MSSAEPQPNMRKNALLNDLTLKCQFCAMIAPPVHTSVMEHVQIVKNEHRLAL